MKNTRNNIFILSGKILILIVFLIFTGCKEEYLKPDPLDLFSTTTTFNKAGLEATLAMADKSLQFYWTYSSAQDRSLPISTECMFSEAAVSAMTDNANIFTDITTMLTPTNRVGDGDDNRISFFWRETYFGIKYANTVVSYIDQATGLDVATRNAFMGRAYFHRSFRYLALCFQFGNVPLLTKVVETPKFNYITTKREAILDGITKDMEKAVQWVPQQSAMNRIGQISKGACRQLLIKCYLATGQWAKAIAHADTLINSSGYQLMQSNFGTFISPSNSTWPITRNVIWDLHRPENKCIPANKEVILGLPNKQLVEGVFIKMRSMRNWLPLLDNRAEVKSPAGFNASRYYSASDANYDAKLDYATAYGRGIAHIRLTDYYTRAVWYVNGINDAGDLRHNSTVGNWMRMDSLKYNNRADVAWYGKNLRLYNPNTGAILCTDTIRCWFDWPHYKTYVPDPTEILPTLSNHRGGAGDWYCFRLAETYLLRAEAKFYSGDITGATTDVNAIRTRAQCTQLYSTVTIGDIMDERLRELYLEEWRHMELSRVSYCLALSGKTDEFGKTYTIGNLSTDSYWWQRVNNLNGFYNKGVVVSLQGNRPYTISAYNIYWPIPQSTIDANSGNKLFQNFGYSGYDATIPMWETWEESEANQD